MLVHFPGGGGGNVVIWCNNPYSLVIFFDNLLYLTNLTISNHPTMVCDIPSEYLPTCIISASVAAWYSNRDSEHITSRCSFKSDLMLWKFPFNPLVQGHSQLLLNQPSLRWVFWTDRRSFRFAVLMHSKARIERYCSYSYNYAWFDRL